MELQKWTQLTSQDMELIKAAIADAEKNTTGEIVPVLARRSSTVGHVPLMVLALFAIVLAAAAGMWHFPIWIWSIFFVAIVLSSRFLSRLDVTQRWLTADIDEIQQVEQLAELTFYRKNIGQTRGATGILLFVSLMEHRAVVLADKGISQKLPPETWNEIVDLLVTGAKQKRLASGFIEAIQRCGQILAEHYPANQENPNELYDQLLILD